MAIKAMETLQDLIEEAKLRTVWWAICIFAITYILTHTSKSMWMNVPIAVFLVSGVHILLNEVDFHWKIRKPRGHSYLAHLEKKQLSVNDSRLSTLPPLPKWKRKIDSPVVEAAMEDFVKKLLQEFVVDLWYSDITPDKEAPQLIHAILMDVFAEISTRVKDINLVDMLTRDVVDLVGDHLELFRKNQAAIGREVMVTLSSDERDERLKHHLMTSKELHPALISPESEYKFLKRIMGGVLAAVLRPREAQCPLVRCIARELITCLIMEPVMRFASPGLVFKNQTFLAQHLAHINELLEIIFLANNNKGETEAGDQSSNVVGPTQNQTQNQSAATNIVKPPESASTKSGSSSGQMSGQTLSTPNNQKEALLNPSGTIVSGPVQDEPLHARTSDWARVLEAATQRRTEVLQPENLENMWTKGRNYKKKAQKNVAPGHQPPSINGSGISSVINRKDLGKEISPHKPEISTSIGKTAAQIPPGPYADDQQKDPNLDANGLSDQVKTPALCDLDNENSNGSSICDLNIQTQPENKSPIQVGGSIISEFYSANAGRDSDALNVNSASDKGSRSEGYVPKLKCRVLGAYFENIDSKSFAVYSIAVTDAGNKTWFVKRRYRNFERLHRHLKDIPNYTLHLPPKRILSSSTEDAFVHQRCIQLDKYLQDLLSIANIAEQHEVWDFLSMNSKVCISLCVFVHAFTSTIEIIILKDITTTELLFWKVVINGENLSSNTLLFSFGLTVNVDDAVDDIVRQFKGVSDGLMRKVVGPLSPSGASASAANRTVPWKAEEPSDSVLKQTTLDTTNNLSDNEEGDKDRTPQHEEMESAAQANGQHLDNELNSKVFPPRVLKSDELNRSLELDKKNISEVRSEILSLAANFPSNSGLKEDPLGVPAEWTPTNVSVPLLNLVDKIFQLNRRGWLRRQAFWISKQILQLIMEDAIDDWLIRQIHWLRRDDIVAQGIRWIQEVLWPEGIFFLKLNRSQMDSSQPNEGSSRTTSGSKGNKQASFEEQLEAARRASDIKKMIFSEYSLFLIGHKQYKRCAKDVYYFLQSAVCLKQLGYGLLELALITVFPELQDVISNVHEKRKSEPLENNISTRRCWSRDK
ncbi:Phox-associated domain-containing protein, partial [Cynara cardunculus var. scolymus]